MAFDDDEFGDEIDWSSIQLPNNNNNNGGAPVSVPTAAGNMNNIMTSNHQHHHTIGGAGAVPMQHQQSMVGNGTAPSTASNNNSGYPQQQYGGGGGMNYSGMGGGGGGVSTSNFSSVNTQDNEALLRQIQELQTQLQSKDDKLFELEATTSAAQSESKHFTQQAESNAQKRIHQYEEEMRRLRQEADKYKNSLLRSKKRVAELESIRSQNNKTGGGASGTGNMNGNHQNNNNRYGGNSNNAAENARMASLSTWGQHGIAGQPPTPTSSTVIELHPSTSHEDYQQQHNSMMAEEDTGGDGNDAMFDNDDASPTKTYSGSKRKTQQQLSNADDDIATDVGKQVTIPIHSSDIMTGDSICQRMARHLLNRDEMGCYSFCNGEDDNSQSDLSSSSSSTTMLVELAADQSSTSAEQHSERERKDDIIVKRLLQQDIEIAKETKAFVKSILFQMMESLDQSLVTMPQGSLTISGLVNVLLLRFNSLFHRQSSEEDGVTTTVDGDGDQVMVENLTTTTQNTTGKRNKHEQQLMVLRTLGEGQDESSSSEIVTYTTVSWRAALYMLRVLQDILLLSGGARDDLRWWLYQARQSEGGGSRSNTNTTNTGDIVDKDGKGGNNEAVSRRHPRIEGLSFTHTSQSNDIADRKETLWTKNCRSEPQQPSSNTCDPMTMTQPCNLFFELLVGLMKGNIVDKLQGASAESTAKKAAAEQTTVVQLVQLKAIDMVLALMSDAPPYDHTQDCNGNRTPYLWKFWFDSLLPSFGSSTSSVATSSTIGDFLSSWEKRDHSSTNKLLGSGRKHSTRLLMEEMHDVTIHQNKKGTEKQGKKKSDKSKESTKIDIPKPQKPLSVLIKGRTIQLLSHIILSSSSVYSSLYEVVNEETKSSLAKRILAALLDHLEEHIIPFLSSPIKFTTHDSQQYLQLCSTCIQFLLNMSKSNEGIRMLRLRMRLESIQEDEPSRWSQSTFGCVVLVLDGTLSFADKVKENGDAVLKKSSNISRVLDTIATQCIALFKTLLRFVEKQRETSSKSTTLLALTCEHRTIFQSCLAKIQTNEELKKAARGLIEELIVDAEKESVDK